MTEPSISGGHSSSHNEGVYWSGLRDYRETKPKERKIFKKFTVELAHVIMEKSHDVPSAKWRTMKASGIIQQ